MSYQILKSKLLQLQRDLTETENSLQKKQALQKDQTILTNEIYCYFTHSILLNQDNGANHLMIGNFYVKNMTNKTRHEPIILIKIEADKHFHFSGTFKTDKQLSQGFKFPWERLSMKELDPQTHYCFQPLENKTLGPEEQLVFQNFRIQFPTGTDIRIEGFTYFDQSNDGTPALNAIHING